MYVATIDTVRHTFQASGSLWQDALVMQDLETETLWSQISGKAIQGSLVGSELTLFPSTVTTFGEFKRLYPKGLLLAKPGQMVKGSPYEQYFADDTRLGIFGRADNFEQLPGKTKVLGLRLVGRDVAVTLERLADNGHVLIENGATSVLIVYDKSSESAFAYELPGAATDVSIDGQKLTVAGSSWNLTTGTSHEGTRQQLEPLPLLSAYWFAWASFFPTSELIK